MKCISALLIFLFTTPSFALTYNEVVNIIQSNGVTTIEGLLPLLPTDFRSNYTLMYNSRSLQVSDYLAPRVIMFGVDARLTCAFNGSTDQVGGDTLECFQFSDDQRAFDFRQIQFPSQKNGLTAVEYSQSGKSADGKVSCANCHSADPRPNWDQYSTWPGAFGSLDDTIFEATNDQGDMEGVNYPKFVAIRDQHPRYKWLIQMSADAYAPYQGTSDAMDHRPNLRFSDFTGKMDAIRAARLLEGAVADWQVLGWAITALTCTPTQAQQDKMTKAGLDFASDTNLETIFKLVGLANNQWSTETFDDGKTDNKGLPDYEHQAGFGFLAEDVAMEIVREHANAGDQIFQQAQRKILDNFANEYSGDSDGGYGPFFQTLNGILLDPDHYTQFSTNVGYICPHLIDLFLPEYLKTAQRKRH